MTNYEDYSSAREAVVALLDNAITSGVLHTHQVQQMLENLVLRYTGWTDGRVPEDALDELVLRWYRYGGDIPIYEFLRITKVQYERWLEHRVASVVEDALTKDGSCQKK